MQILKEFKDFAMKGNVVDMAVGVIIGAAFGKIVTSLVSDVVMPPLGFLMGGMDFSNMELVLKQAVGDAPAVSLRYGIFINCVINFLIQAASIFMIIRAMNHLNKLSARQK